MSNRTNNNESKNIVRNSIISGSCAGCASTLILYPMDVIRTRLQTGASGSTGPIQALKATLEQGGGIRALYTGLTLPLLAQIVYKSNIFTIYNTTEHALIDFRLWQKGLQSNPTPNNPTSILSYTDRALCGITAGAVNGAVFVTPVEYVRNQTIASLHHGRCHQNGWEVIRYAINERGGISSLWRGMGWTVGRDAWGCGWFFAAVAGSRDLMQQHQEQLRLSDWQITLISGANGGLFFWLSSLPLDTMKTWVQSELPVHCVSTGSTTVAHVSPREILMDTYRQGGLWAVFSQLQRGWQVAYGRGIPSAALTVSIYTFVYNQLKYWD